MNPNFLNLMGHPMVPMAMQPMNNLDLQQMLYFQQLVRAQMAFPTLYPPVSTMMVPTSVAMKVPSPIMSPLVMTPISMPELPRPQPPPPPRPSSPIYQHSIKKLVADMFNNNHINYKDVDGDHVEVKPYKTPPLPISEPRIPKVEAKPKISFKQPSVEERKECTSSPSCSKTETLLKYEDLSEELFVDVESIDNPLDTKERRQACSEFYKKLKNLWKGTEKTPLKCAICAEEVPRIDSFLKSHIAKHANEGYRCRLCGFDNIEQSGVYEHMLANHPDTVILIEDRRDMKKMSATMEDCFPKSFQRNKKDNKSVMQKILNDLTSKNLDKIDCAKCHKKVTVSLESLTKHAQSHPYYKCKLCKKTTPSQKDQIKHQMKKHKIAIPQLMVEYNICTAVDVMTKVFLSCYPESARC